MIWRLGLDVGTNSLGWWAFRLKREGGEWIASESLDGGVRIFSDGREPSRAGRVGDSNAVERRRNRGMRRNRDRGRNRINRLVDDLISLDLLPKDKEKRDALFKTEKNDRGDKNPYRLRAEALERDLSPQELGRAILHLAKRRGFKSNRKEASDDEGGKLKARMDAMKEALGERTLGQFMWERLRKEDERERNGERRNGIRFRGETEFYPSREMYAAEFDAIRERQQPCHALADVDWDRLRDCSVLFQHDLKPVERGACEFLHDQPRHWRDTPVGHEFRIFQELNNLRLVDENFNAASLSAEQREAVLDRLMSQATVSFGSLRKLKGDDGKPLFPRDSTFNLEGPKRKELKGHALAMRMRKDPLLAALWRARSDGDGGRLDDIFETLHSAPDDADKAISELTEAHDLEDGAARALVGLKLGDQTASVSRRFMEMIVPVMRDQGLPYWEAATELADEEGNPIHHSLRGEGRKWPLLPYYGEVIPSSMLGADKKADPQTDPEKFWGRINNPTVHVALNQIRQLVNALTRRFGPPMQVHVEMARELKQPKKAREETDKRQAAEQERNDGIRKAFGLPEEGAFADIKKIKLWEELGDEEPFRRCVFTGRPISKAMLMNGEAEIEHLLPFRRTLDDSMANLTVALRWANRLKGNNSPYEAFGNDQHADQGVIWEEILQRAEKLPMNKRWRFSSNAMERFESDPDNDFIARQLTDTAYMARVATRYLKALEGVEQVVPTRGRLTALARGKWRLNAILSDHNRKNREDHRHHAIDAAVTALIDRGVLQQVSAMTARGADDLVHLRLPDLPENLETAIRRRVPEIVVSFKPDHGLQGKMFNETAYGLIDETKRDPDLPQHNLVTRKPLASLTPKECEAIRDPLLRSQVRDYLYEAKGARVKHKKALAEFAKESGIRKVRILVVNATATPIESASYNGEPYKAYAPESYVCCDIWRMPKGKPGKWKPGEFQWGGEFWSYVEAAEQGDAPDPLRKRPHPAAKFVARLFKDDIVAYEDEGRSHVMRVAGFSTTNNKLDLQPHNKAIPKQNYISINVLGQKGLKKVSVSPDGRLLPSRRLAR